MASAAATAASSPRPAQLAPVTVLRLSELLGALSHAIDLTEGQPEGHSVRCCWIGIHIGREMGLSEPDLWELYYALILKDAGCSSNSSRIAQIFQTDDLMFKHDFKIAGDSKASMLRFTVAHTGSMHGMIDRFRALMGVVQAGGISNEVIATRCERGADIARQLRFNDKVAEAIRFLDEHWDGEGRPTGAKGNDIPLYAQIALLAQVVDCFNMSAGRETARREVVARSGTWFNPALVSEFEKAASKPGFWEGLSAPNIESAVLDLEPARHVQAVDEDYLDDIATGFAQIVDSKSPYTSGHSTRVAGFADRVAAELGFTIPRRRWLRRAALLHDIGKLGVSSLILDKPGRLDDEEMAAMRNHAALTEKVLSRINAFSEMARVAGAHHERLDGKGYPHRIGGSEIVMESRVITVADIFDALTAKRPYRDAMPEADALAIMARDVGTAVDPDCFRALKSALARHPLLPAA